MYGSVPACLLLLTYVDFTGDTTMLLLHLWGKKHSDVGHKQQINCSIQNVPFCVFILIFLLECPFQIHLLDIYLLF